MKGNNILQKKQVVIIFISLIIFSVVLIYLNKVRTRHTEVTLFEPTVEEGFDDINKPLKIHFSNLKEEDKELIQVATSPAVELEGSWENDTLTLIPVYWKPDTTYRFLIYKNTTLLKDFSLSTLTSSQLSEEDKYFIEGVESGVTAELINDLYEESPWIKELPIITEEYIIIYEYDKAQIRIRLLNTADMDNSEIKSFQQKAQFELTRLEVPDDIPVEFILD